MPSRVPLPRGWSVLGVLLPADVRRRLFEPAYYDLMREQLGSHPGDRAERRMAIRALTLFLASSWYGAQLMLLDRRRVARIVIGLFVVAAASSVILSFLLREWIFQIAAR